MKKMRKVIITILVSLLLELGCFNYKPMANFLQGRKSLTFSENDFTYVNWEEKDGARVSLVDPMIIKDNLSIFAETVTIRMKTEPEPGEYVVFYTTDKDEAFSADKMIYVGDISDEVVVQLNQSIAAIRVDPGDEAGRRLIEVSFSFNEAEWDVSVARIVAMLVVWWGTTGLMKLQRAPDYGIEEKDDSSQDK